MFEALKLFNGLFSHYPVSVFSPCLLRVLPNGGTNRFIWDGNYSSFKQWAHHQITTEGWANMSHVVSTSRTWTRGRQNGPIKTVSDYPTSLSVIYLHHALPSCFYLLPVCLVTDGVFGGVPCQCFSCQCCLFRLSSLSFSEQRQRETRERYINWRVSCRAVLFPSFQTRGNSRALGWHCSLTSFPNASTLSTLEYGMMTQFHPVEGTDVCCDEGLLTTRKLLQSGNWQQAGSTPPNISSNVPRCCWNSSVGIFICLPREAHA